jgi:hypothetical protein
MEMGMDGIFIDCVGLGNRKCYGPDLGKHRHVHPEWSGDQASIDIQKDLYVLVKSYGEDRVVILNTSHRPEYLRFADAYMHESYIVTSSRYRWLSWERILQIKKEDEPALNAGKVVLALSYIGYTPYGPDEDALYCYACARLFGYSWADYFTLADARATLLYRLQLGTARSGILEYNGLLYGIFENGVVVVNPYKAERELRVKTGFNQGLRDVMTNRRYANADLQENLMQDLKGDEMYTPWPVDLWVTIPGEAGRVYLTGDQEPE